MLQLRTILAGAALALALPAHADPITDFKKGTSVRIASSTVALSDDTPTASSTNKTVTKVAGSLDFKVKASDLGFPSVTELLMRVRSTGGSNLELTTDNIYATPIDVGAGIRVSRITGKLPGRATWVPGAMPPVTGGNVRLALDDSSYLVVHTNLGPLTVMVKHTTLIGGLPQPPLSTFSTTAVICSDTVVKRYPFTLRLAGNAQAAAAPIDIRGPLRGVLFPHTVLVPKNLREVTVNARIEKNFVGTVRITAAAGGVKRALDVVVRRREECPR